MTLMRFFTAEKLRKIQRLVENVLNLSLYISAFPILVLGLYSEDQFQIGRTEKKQCISSP